jgi:hypothetical protein
MLNNKTSSFEIFVSHFWHGAMFFFGNSKIYILVPNQGRYYDKACLLIPNLPFYFSFDNQNCFKEVSFK